MPTIPAKDRKTYRYSARQGEAKNPTIKLRKGARAKVPAAKPLNAAEAAAPSGKQAESDAIYERISALKDRYAGQLEKDELYESLYHMESDDEPEEGEEQVKSSKPFDVVNLATDLLATNMPLVDVPPASETHADEVDADVAEKFVIAMWATWTRRSSEPIIAQMAHDANLLGRYALRETYIDDPAAVPEDGLPIRLQVRDPKYCYPEFDADKQLWGMAECWDRPVGEIRRTLPGVKLPTNADGEDLQDDDTVEWAEWWDAVRCVYFVGGEEVYRLDHDHGRIPYVFGYGRFVRSDKPERRAVSILKGIESTAFAYDRLLSTELTAVIANVFSAWQFTSERGDAFKPDFNFRAINHIFPNEKFEPLQRQGELADLQGVKATLREEMDNTTFRAMLGQSDASSGYAFSQVTRGEKLKINPVKQSLDIGLARIFELGLHLIGRSNKKVTLYVPRLPGISDYGYSGFAEMTPARARKHKQVYVSIPPDYLEDQQKNVAMALQATAGQSPLVDKDTARRIFMGQTDTTRIENRIIEEKLMEQALPVWFTQYLLPRLGIQPAPPQGQQGAPQQMQQNNGMPITTSDTPYIPDSEQGVPPLSAGDTGNAEAINALMGQGMAPDMASQLMMSQGTPQSSGRGR